MAHNIHWRTKSSNKGYTIFGVTFSRFFLYKMLSYRRETALQGEL